MSGFSVVICLTLLVHATRAQQADQPAYLRVKLPQDDATLLFDGKETKQEGATRIFVTPKLPAGKTFKYTLTASWEPNNYTEVIRTRVVEVQAGKTVEVDLTRADPNNPDKFVIGYYPTPMDVVQAMCKLAAVGKDDVVYDLGCGDGRIVITAVTEFKAKRGVGVDIDPDLVKLAAKYADKAKVADKVAFRQQDVLTLKDLSDASVVMLYMGEDVNARLLPILKSTLKPGSRIVSLDFKMGDWQADKSVKMVDDFGDDHILYLWTIGKK